MNSEIIDFYTKAKTFVQESQSYSHDQQTVFDLVTPHLTPDYFFREYTFVVLASGMRNQVAFSIYEKFMNSRDFNTIGHPLKRKAIMYVSKNLQDIYDKYVSSTDKLEFLDSLPFIGPITKYHLARNLGNLDIAKPDRWLVRIAKKFGYLTPNDVKITKIAEAVNQMCKDISNITGDRIGIVDLYLFRYGNLNQDV